MKDFLQLPKLTKKAPQQLIILLLAEKEWHTEREMTQFLGEVAHANDLPLKTTTRAKEAIFQWVSRPIRALNVYRSIEKELGLPEM